MPSLHQAAEDIPPPRLAWSITAFALACFASIAVVNVLAEGRTQPGFLAGYLACVAAVFAVQVAHTLPAARRWSPRTRALSLTLQAVLTYAPLLGFGMSWGGMGGPLAGSVLLLVPGRVAWCLFALIAASFTIVPLSLGVPLLPTSYFTISTILTGLVIYGLSRLSDLVVEVHATRGQLASMAVDQERLRFARDLHDLLGYSLSAITLKSEVVHRLLPGDPERARQEVASTMEVARQALADIRSVSHGYRELSPGTEARTVGTVLTVAGIDARVETEELRLSPAASTVLATVVREGATNILRHSSVTCCLITLRKLGNRAVLEIVNDGVEQVLPVPSVNGGSGLGNLRERVVSIDGEFEAGPVGGGTFRVYAAVPLASSREGHEQGALAAKQP